MTDHKQQLQSQLWNIANDLRGNMGADEFRDYILGFIFFKYLSEKIQQWADKQLKSDGITFIDLIAHTEREDYLEGLAEESVGALGFFLKPHQLFSVLAARGGEHSDGHDTLIQDVEEAFRDIEQSVAGAESSDDFDGLFNEIDLYSTKLGKDKPQRSKLIGKVLIHLNKIDFQLENTEIDVLGDAYEYLISQFASGAGKKAGEFYTPQEVSSILSKIVTTGKDRLESVYDPTCGSGSLLLRVAKEVEKVGMFYGQEMNPTTYNLARMNMILHDVSYRYFDIKQNDTLEKPEHKNIKFDAIVANPPFSAKWSGDSLKMDDERFGMYGKLAPSSKADYAFVTHMLHHLSDSGTMALVLPHGALYRGGAEKDIRRHIIGECNWLDAVIGLPSNIFYGTGIPTCIMVFKKFRDSDTPILFVDASREYKKQKNQNVLEDIHINRIIEIYNKRKEVERFSKNVSRSDIYENDFNLNITRYVDTFIRESIVDLDSLELELTRLFNENERLDKELSVYFDQLGLKYSKAVSLNGLKKLKMGLTQKLFSQELRFRDQNDLFFEEWVEYCLNDIGTFYSGLSGKNSSHFGIGSCKYIQYKQVFDSSIINLTDCDSVSIGFNEKQHPVKRGDVFFTTSSETASEVAFSSVLLEEPTIDTFLNSFCFGFRLSNKIEPEFAQFLFRTDAFRKSVFPLAQGSTRYNVSKKEVGKLRVQLPSNEEQKLIAAVLSTLDQKIKVISKY